MTESDYERGYEAGAIDALKAGVEALHGVLKHLQAEYDILSDALSLAVNPEGDDDPGPDSTGTI